MLIVGLGVAAPAAASADVSDRTAQVEGQSSAPVTLDDAPDGVQRYNLTVTLESPDGATIESASAGDVEGFEVRSQSDDAITFRAADLAENVEAGATDVTLATVEFAGGDGGTPTFDVTTHDFQNDEGEQIQPTLSVDASGGGSADGIAEMLPGTPIIWAIGALALTLGGGILVAWRR